MLMFMYTGDVEVGGCKNIVMEAVLVRIVSDELQSRNHVEDACFFSHPLFYINCILNAKIQSRLMF